MSNMSLRGRKFNHKSKNSGIRPLILKLDRIFSQFIRLRDADENGICRCITSGTPHHWKECDCGHFIPRQHMSTRFDEHNCHAQSRKDNWLGHGEQHKYREAIIKKYGENELNRLLWAKGQTKKWSHFELEALIKHYTERVKELRGI